MPREAWTKPSRVSSNVLSSGETGRARKFLAESARDLSAKLIRYLSRINEENQSGAGCVSPWKQHLSQRQYIEVNGIRCYFWTEPQSEYICDVCGCEIRSEEAQVHLYIRNGMHRKADGTVVHLEWFGLELHEDCIGVAGVQMYEKIVGIKKKPRDDSQLSGQGSGDVTQVFTSWPERHREPEQQRDPGM
jgi:hypothetical protein